MKVNQSEINKFDNPDKTHNFVLNLSTSDDIDKTYIVNFSKESEDLYERERDWLMEVLIDDGEISPDEDPIPGMITMLMTLQLNNNMDNERVQTLLKALSFYLYDDSDGDCIGLHIKEKKDLIFWKPMERKEAEKNIKQKMN